LQAEARRHGADLVVFVDYPPFLDEEVAQGFLVKQKQSAKETPAPAPVGDAEPAAGAPPPAEDSPNNPQQF
jgi:hypothetical protein